MKFLLFIGLLLNCMENQYLSDTQFPIIKDHYVIITGCSGGGKSTLLSELANRGYTVVQEPGRQIVKEQMAIEGDGLPWVNLEKFLELALSRYLYFFNSQKGDQTTFFDRGIIDALQLDQPQASYFRKAAERFRYYKHVFLVPPWEEIYANDPERKHDFESAKKEYEELLIKYKEFEYEVIIIPKYSVKERADFVLDRLNIN